MAEGATRPGRETRQRSADVPMESERPSRAAEEEEEVYLDGQRVVFENDAEKVEFYEKQIALYQESIAEIVSSLRMLEFFTHFVIQINEYGWESIHEMMPKEGVEELQQQRDYLLAKDLIDEQCAVNEAERDLQIAHLNKLSVQFEQMQSRLYQLKNPNECLEQAQVEQLLSNMVRDDDYRRLLASQNPENILSEEQLVRFDA